MLRDDLERACRTILKRHQGAGEDSLPVRNVLRHMALTLDQLQRSDKTKSEFLQTVEYFRSDTRNRMLQLRRDPYEHAEARVERDNNVHRFTVMLIKLESQRREIMSLFASEERQQEMRLAELLSKYELLTTYDGDE